MYITKDGERLEGDEAMQAAKDESNLDYAEVMESIRAVGVKSQDKQDLEYWGLPSGLIEKLKA